jgi:hypothetical protein
LETEKVLAAGLAMGAGLAVHLESPKVSVLGQMSAPKRGCSWEAEWATVWEWKLVLVRVCLWEAKWAAKLEGSWAAKLEGSWAAKLGGSWAAKLEELWGEV